MLNKVAIEGICQRKKEKSYFGKFNKYPIFICPFTTSGYMKTYYVRENIVFFGDFALKAYEKLEQDKAYLILGKLSKFYYIFGLFKKGEDDIMIADFFKTNEAVVIGEKIYKSSSHLKLKKSENKGLTDEELKAFNATFEETDTSVRTDNLELIAERDHLRDFPKMKVKTDLKEYLKKKGIENLENE